MPTTCPQKTEIAPADPCPEPERVSPPCRLFGRCGGCTLQRMSQGAIARLKSRLVQEALVAAGFALPAETGFTACPPASRRRMDVGLRRTSSGVIVGLHAADGALVDLSECHVLDPSLFGLIGRLRAMLLRLGCLGTAGSAIANLLDSGPDLLLATDRAPDSADRIRLARFAEDAAIPRIAWRSVRDGGVAETICALAPVRHALSGAQVSPPPGAFLQASREGERAIVGSVLAGLAESLPSHARVIELYAGCGTLSFALAARGWKIRAVEGDGPSFDCLRAGVADGMRLRTERRDLVRQPLLSSEFAGASAIVLDPPFAGAGPQMSEIALAGVRRVVLVSCNPRALAKESRLLGEAGYTLERLDVIDQFVWSRGVESVAVFVRDRRGQAPSRRS